VVTLWASQSGHLVFPLDTSKEGDYFENTCYNTTQSISYVTRLLCESHNTKTDIEIYCYKLFKIGEVTLIIDWLLYDKISIYKQL